MTIFIALVIPRISDVLQSIDYKSHKEDKSWTNKCLRFMTGNKCGRNPELSEDKRTLAQEFGKALTDDIARRHKSAKEQGVLPKDVDLYTAIQKMITTYGAKGLDKTADKKQQSGNYEKMMSVLGLYLKLVYEKLESESLLDKPKNVDPLNIFHYHAARYFENKIYDYTLEYTNSFAEVTIRMIYSFIQSEPLTKAKEALLSRYLKECEKTLTELSKESKDDLNICKNHLVTQLVVMETENKKLCDDHAPWNGNRLPIRVSFWASMELKLKSRSGQLGKCIQDTCEELEKCYPNRVSSQVLTSKM